MRPAVEPELAFFQEREEILVRNIVVPGQDPLGLIPEILGDLGADQHRWYQPELDAHPRIFPCPADSSAVMYSIGVLHRIRAAQAVPIPLDLKKRIIPA